MALFSVAFGLGLAIAGVLAWYLSRRSEERRPPSWRDTSLDDWRSERDRAAEEERRRRSGDDD